MRERLGSLALLTVGCVLAGAMGECSARTFGLSKTWDSYRSAPDYMSLDMSTGELIGFRRLSSQTWPAPSGTQTRTNAAGFRGPELPQGAQESGFRLVWLGDSVTEGYGVAELDRFSARFQQRLTDELAVPIESINLAVAGHSTVDQVAVWEQLGAQLKPDILVVQLGDNDVAGNLLKADAFASGAWDQPNPGVVTAEPSCAVFRRGDDQQRCSLKQMLQRHSALYLAVAERYQTFRIRSGSGAEKSAFLAPVDDAGWDAMRGALVRLLSTVDSSTQVVLLYLPVAPRVQAPKGSAPGGLGERLTADSDLAMRATVVDATDALREGQGLFLDDVHLTPGGHDHVAELLDQLIAVPVGSNSAAENPDTNGQDR